MGITDGGCSASLPPELSNAPATSDDGGGGGASKFLSKLSFRGNFSSTVLSFNLGDSGVKNGKGAASSQGSRKRSADKSLDGKAAGKKAISSTQHGSAKGNIVRIRL